MTNQSLLLSAAARAPQSPPAPPLLPSPSRMETMVRAAMSGHPRVLEHMMDGLGVLAVNLIVALFIVALSVWVSGWGARLARRALARVGRHPNGDTLLQSFISSFVRWAILIVGLIAVLQQLGVQTTSILAMLGAASLAIGLALQGALSNVAASVMILILRPYRIGDVVEINGKMGTVQGLDLFGTRLADPDNLEIFMPNSKVFGEMIVNYSSPSNRRMELNFRVDYDDDLDVALAVLTDCVKADKRVLAKPEPWTGVTALAENSVTVTLRAWAPVGVYWDARFDMLRRVKDRLQAAGMTVPYPRQITVEPQPKLARAPKADAHGEPAPAAPAKAGRRKSSGNQPPSQEGV